MTRLKAVLTAAAVLILGGLGVGVALNQAGVTHGMGTQEWCAAIGRVNDIQQQDRFFVALQPGNPIPQAHGEYVLGACADNVCAIAPAAAPECAYTYSYSWIGPAIDGWRVAEVYAHHYIANGWRMAAADLAYLKWFGSTGALITACLAHTTPAKCAQLLSVDAWNWVLTDDTICRRGIVQGTEADPCPYLATGIKCKLPEVVYRGAGSEMTDCLREWTDAEMDEL